MDLDDLLAKADDIVADIEGDVFSVSVFNDRHDGVWPDIQLHLNPASSRNRAMHSLDATELLGYTDGEVRVTTLDGYVVALIGGCV